MSLSRQTALEIRTNPYDLQITIGTPEGSAMIALRITRGLACTYKPLLTAYPFTNRAGALTSLEILLSEVLAADEITSDNTLNRELIAQIIAAFREGGDTVSTETLALAGK